MITRKITIYISLAILTAALFTTVFSNEIGLMKSIVDSKTGLTFNNFISDSLETIFYEVKIDNGLVYDSPKNNADPIYSLSVNSIVEYLEMGPKKNFIKIRLIDNGTDIIEGWVRKKILSSMKFYGRSYLTFLNDNSEVSNIENKLIDPQWIKESNQKVFFNKSMSGEEAAILNKGDIVFVDSLFHDAAMVKHRSHDGVYMTYYVDKKVLSPLAIIENGRTDFDELFKEIDPFIFIYDFNRSGFISYSGITISKALRNNFNEDKVCRELGADSLMYKFTFSDNVYDVIKKYESKHKPPKNNFAMYRILPDEKIITRADTLNCKVIEIVHTPKSAVIALNNIEEMEITNMISKFYINHIENLNMDIVFQKETNEYFWSYKKNLDDGTFIEQKYKPTQIVKRVIAFRKYDLDK